MAYLTSDVDESSYVYDPPSYFSGDDNIFWCFSHLDGVDDLMKEAWNSNESTENFSGGKAENSASADDYFSSFWSGNRFFTDNGGGENGYNDELEKTESSSHGEQQLAWHGGYLEEPFDSDLVSSPVNGFENIYAEEEEYDDIQDEVKSIYSYNADEPGFWQWVFDYSPCPFTEYSESYGELKADERSYDHGEAAAAEEDDTAEV
ncbi:hypothetical protein Nepgr_025523 [Nepenthes gracilis]|uniref:Uncharacterized protein n=1 Tax=Nepenthes gracilis TaxID=150966 RepID=A0AAD3T677_NEPGR|nr:hypothetical protein Nepgr_025523 [Nepenthes gracilis]